MTCDKNIQDDYIIIHAYSSRRILKEVKCRNIPAWHIGTLRASLMHRKPGGQ